MGCPGTVGRGFASTASPFAYPTTAEMDSAVRDGAALAGTELTCWVISTEPGQVDFPPQQRGSGFIGRASGRCSVQIKMGMEATLNHDFVTSLLEEKPTRNPPINPQRFSLLHCLISLAAVFPDQLTDLISRELDVRFRALFWELRARFATHSPESHRWTQCSEHAPGPALLRREVKGTLWGRF